jgi:hypothetical protein
MSREFPRQASGYDCLRQAAMNMPFEFNSCGQRKTEFAEAMSAARAGVGSVAPVLPGPEEGNTGMGANSGCMAENPLAMAVVSARVNVQTE